jgi:gas vesicle protein
MRLISFLFVVLLSLGLASCNKEESAAGDENQATVESAMESVADDAATAVDEAGDAIDESVDDAMDAVEESADDAMDAVEDTMEDAEETIE